MKLEGGCYCGKMRYVTEGEPIIAAQCHCRECQYNTEAIWNAAFKLHVEKNVAPTASKS